jgi:MoaA/NifB/PqqE/SkfB family radical SAM enzyme
MSTLVSITAIGQSPASEFLSAHRIDDLPILVIAAHNQCNCRCMMCDIWRIREPLELTPTDLGKHISAIRELKVQWAAFTGGEPQLNRNLFSLARTLKDEGIRVTLLTAGLLLEDQASELASTFDDVIVSLDGPREVHDAIRRVARAFDKIAAGVRTLRNLRADMPISARCTVQRANRRSLRAAVQATRGLGLNSISFLAADLTSAAFNHADGWPDSRKEKVALTISEVGELATEIEALIEEHTADFDSRFIVESPAKLRRIVQHFRADLGETGHVAPRCNAPWVSAVVEASGDVKPCFFHPAIGNIHQRQLSEILNSPQAVQFRANLDIATNPVCRRCVCSLNYRPDGPATA